MIFMQVKSLESRVSSLSLLPLKLPLKKWFLHSTLAATVVQLWLKRFLTWQKTKQNALSLRWHTSRYFSLHHMLLACTISLTGEIGQAAINTVTLSDARLNSTVTASCKHVDTYLNYSQQSAGAAWCGHTGIQCTPHKHNDWRRSGWFLSTGGTAAQMQWK